MPTRNAFHELWVAKAAANTGARVETEPSISPTRPGWMTCRTKRRLASASSLARLSPGRCLASSSAAVRSCSVRLRRGRPAACGSRHRWLRAAACDRSGRRHLLHLASLRAHGVDAQRLHLPARPALDPAADVLPADQRNVIAEFSTISVDELSTVVIFLLRHIDEDLRAVGIVGAQPLREVGKDPAVLLLAADGQGQDFAFGEFGKIAHRAADLTIAPRTIKSRSKRCECSHSHRVLDLRRLCHRCRLIALRDGL